MKCLLNFKIFKILRDLILVAAFFLSCLFFCLNEGSYEICLFFPKISFIFPQTSFHFLFCISSFLSGFHIFFVMTFIKEKKYYKVTNVFLKLATDF